MVNNHLKRIAAPRSWNIERKGTTFVMKPNPGAHPIEHSMPLSLVMREILKVARTAKEAKTLIKTKDVFVDKKKRSEERLPVGLMDVIEFPQIEEHYRMLIDSKGRLMTVKIDAKESGMKLSRIESKTRIKGGKTQLTLSGGRNIIVDKDVYAVGDSLQLSLPDQKVQEHIKFEKGAFILLVGGKHAGTVAKMEELNKDKIIIKVKNQKYETSKRYAFVVGKDKPVFDSLKQLS
ncbi:MAG: 30S ribosomal protein S4e [Candidatus Woesearchaeota archaeon]